MITEFEDNDRVFLLDIGGGPCVNSPSNRGVSSPPDATDLFTRHQRDRLLRERESITVDRPQLECEHLADVLDRVARTQAEYLDATLMAAKLQRLQEIDIALEAIGAGDYHRCENCGEAIENRRLEAIPWVRLCVTCQGMSESR